MIRDDTRTLTNHNFIAMIHIDFETITTLIRA